RVILASLAAGVLVALVLTMVVRPGAPEAVVTGSFLVGFGLGWALIAVLSQRWTNRPQRWAAVPAAVMGATGAALVVFAPGTDTMTALNWCWPPVMLALAVWSMVQMRRALPGRSGRGGRWLLTPILVALALASVGATYADLTMDANPQPAAGHLYNIDGHRTYLECHGHGGPTVVLSNGLGESSASWTRISGPLAAITRVCAFDRPGQGWSQAADHPEDGVASAHTLHAVLSAAGEQGPFVLVGHSTGGPYAMNFAATYPDQVAGMVLLDSSSPEQFHRMPAYPTQYALMRRGFALLPTLYRLGFSGILAATPRMPEAAASQAHTLAATPRAAQNARDELSVIPQVFKQAQSLTTLGHRPLEVLTASNNLTTKGWAGAQDQLAALSDDSVHRTVHATHQGMVEDPGPAAQATRAITAVVAAVRSGTPLPAP
ncbi:MAG: alpha/beta hydrolase, partial [Marmoricola sp.]|nr:alpha/beta hydrolase [Marmoricola sp.]